MFLSLPNAVIIDILVNNQQQDSIEIKSTLFSYSIKLLFVLDRFSPSFNIILFVSKQIVNLIDNTNFEFNKSASKISIFVQDNKRVLFCFNILFYFISNYLDSNAELQLFNLLNQRFSGLLFCLDSNNSNNTDCSNNRSITRYLQRFLFFLLQFVDIYLIAC